MKYLYLTFIICLLAATALAGPLQPGLETQEEAIPVMAAPIRFFQKFLSGADGDRCPMTPSCSSYAIQAMQRHGAVKGWVMAADRLIRCGHDELTLSPSVMTRNGARCKDPVDNNDFWPH